MSQRKSGCARSCWPRCSPWFPPALAERPMAVDDAGTLERGAQLGSAGPRRRGARYEGAAVSVRSTMSRVEVGYGRAKDRDADPDAKIRAVGAAVKWVPLRSEAMLSARPEDTVWAPASAARTPACRALSGLATWAFEQDPRCMKPRPRWARATRTRTSGSSASTLPSPSGSTFVETFGAGIPARIARSVCATTIAEGVKISGAVGRGNDRNIANVAWPGSSERPIPARGGMAQRKYQLATFSREPRVVGGRFP